MRSTSHWKSILSPTVQQAPKLRRIIGGMLSFIAARPLIRHRCLEPLMTRGEFLGRQRLVAASLKASSIPGTGCSCRDTNLISVFGQTMTLKFFHIPVFLWVHQLLWIFSYDWPSCSWNIAALALCLCKAFVFSSSAGCQISCSESYVGGSQIERWFSVYSYFWRAFRSSLCFHQISLLFTVWLVFCIDNSLFSKDQLSAETVCSDWSWRQCRLFSSDVCSFQ